MAKLKVVHKWVGLGRVQSFMLILGRVGSGQENWIHVQLWYTCGFSVRGSVVLSVRQNGQI